MSAGHSHDLMNKRGGSCMELTFQGEERANKPNKRNMLAS